MEVKEYQALKEELSQVNEKLSVLSGKKESLVKQLKGILDKYGVSKVSELNALYQKTKEEADKVAEEAKVYIAEVNAKLSEVEGSL